MKQEKQTSFSGCKECGGEEFISQPNQYDVFVPGEDDELIWVDSESIDEELKLFCRNCGTKLSVKKEVHVIRDE